MDTNGDAREAAGTPGWQLSDDRLVSLRQHLNALHLEAGRPSYRDIVRRSAGPISHTSVGRVLRCASLPRWGHIETVLYALGVDPEQQALARRLWVAAARPDTSAAIGSKDGSSMVMPSGSSGSADSRLPDVAGAHEVARSFGLSIAGEGGRLGGSSHSPRTTVFTIGPDLYMTDFYRYLSDKITAARQCIYITGEGAQDDSGSESLHAELVAAVHTALERGVEVNRLQTRVVITDFWMAQLQWLVGDYPGLFELRAVTRHVTG